MIIHDDKWTERGGKARERRERRKREVKGGDRTHRGRLVARPGSGIWTQVAGDAWALEGPAGDQAGAGHGAVGLQGLGTGDGGLKMRRRRRRRRSSKQNPAPSIPLPEATSRTAGPPGAFLWGAWLTPPLLLDI